MTTIFIVSTSEIARALKALQAAARDGVIEEERLQLWQQRDGRTLLLYRPAQIDVGEL